MATDPLRFFSSHAACHTQDPGAELHAERDADQKVSLSDFRASPSCWRSHPADWSPVCVIRWRCTTRFFPSSILHQAMLIDFGGRRVVPRGSPPTKAALPVVVRLRTEGGGGPSLRCVPPARGYHRLLLFVIDEQDSSTGAIVAGRGEPRRRRT
jgi:hypothetical protein